MRSSELDLNKYNTDKLESGYLKKYDPIFGPFVEKKIKLLEIGVLNGASLLLWRDYFPLGAITGIDINVPSDWQATERVRIFEGSQSDTQFLSRIANETAPDGFDIIIDDASHIGSLTKVAFWHLFDNHLKPNGLYVIEDWGTGYWDDWDDGKSLNLESYTNSEPAKKTLWKKIARRLGLNTKSPLPSHDYGMVGFIKQLIDEQGASDVTKKIDDVKYRRTSKFENMVITEGIVFIKKAGDIQRKTE
ncbi:MAG: hypothetical protein JWR02_1813 [Mucilaginibacter sp.]|nr:hypothetical protein [Mucilaginibacter sp.]